MSTYSNLAGTMSDSFAIGKRGVKLLQGTETPTSALAAPIGSLYLKKSGGTVRVYQLVAAEQWEPLLIAGSIPFLLTQSDPNIPNGKTLSTTGGALQFSPSTGALTIVNNPVFSGVGGIVPPVGTTGQRPSSPAQGQTRFNTTLGALETYNGTNWKASGTAVFRSSFTNATLASGILTVTHAIGEQFVQVTVIDNNNRAVIPDEVEMISTTQTTIHLSSFGTLTGTWRVVVTG